MDNVCNSDDYVLQTETIKRFSAGTKTMDEARPEENRLSNALLKIRLSGWPNYIIQNRDFRRISIMESDARKFYFKSQGKIIESKQIDYNLELGVGVE